MGQSLQSIALLFATNEGEREIFHDVYDNLIVLLYNPYHEAILRMIKMVVDNGHKAGIWVGICGELAADITLTEKFLRMGVDEISVAAPFVLEIRDKVRKIDLGKMLA